MTAPAGSRSAASRQSPGASRRPKPSMPHGAKARWPPACSLDAKPTDDNAFKVPLVERTLAAAMAEARA